MLQGQKDLQKITEETTMASTNKKNKAALSSIKMQAANEVGVPLKDNGYNGDLTSKQAGSIGGQMVKKMIESYEMSNQQ
jgi:small acid-soluble spore protein D (minor alpha/beta-type SASP)